MPRPPTPAQAPGQQEATVGRDLDPDLPPGWGEKQKGNWVWEAAGIGEGSKLSLKPAPGFHAKSAWEERRWELPPGLTVASTHIPTLPWAGTAQGHRETQTQLESHPAAPGPTVPRSPRAEHWSWSLWAVPFGPQLPPVGVRPVGLGSGPPQTRSERADEETASHYRPINCPPPPVLPNAKRYVFRETPFRTQECGLAPRPHLRK